MKKIFFALFAVLAMVSCSNEEVIEVNREQIAFGEIFVDNATRADYSSGETVDAFKVYGTVQTSVATTPTQIFNGADVERNDKANGVAWDCNGTAQYWLPSSTYNFAAIVDGEAVATSTLPATINHAVADGAANKDLLYATATITTNANAVPNNVNTNGVVAFDFSHLLSKLQFNIVNATNQNYKVTSISVSGVAQDGIYTVDGGTWAKNGNATTTLTFVTDPVDVAGSATVEVSEARQLLPVPVAQTLNVTITYDVYDNKGNKSGTLTKTGTITETFVKNTVYAVTLTISGSAINFSFKTVSGWTEVGDNNITI